MMKRIAGSIVVVVALAVSMGTASAQQADYPPGTTPPGPPATVGPPFIEGGSFVPGTRQNIGVAAAAIQLARSYRGTLNSTPVALPATVAASAGAVLWTDVLIPADFALGANHSITVVDDATGAVVAVSNFYVGADGKVHATAPSGSGSGSGSGAGGSSGSSGQSGSTRGQLARTGSDSDLPAKLGVGLVALGGLIVLTVRKRHDQTVTSS